MQEQNFEKQVQHKLEELSLTPSAPVWQKVEKEIHEKKKRRRAIVFWLLPLLVGTGMFWGIQIVTNKKDHPTSKVDISKMPIENRQSSISSNKQLTIKTVNQSVTTRDIGQKAAAGTTKNDSLKKATPNNSPASVTANATTTITPTKLALIKHEEISYKKPVEIQIDKPAIIAKKKRRFNQSNTPRPNSTDALVIGETIAIFSERKPNHVNLALDRITELTANPLSSSISKAQPLEQLITTKEEIHPTIHLDSIQNKKGQHKVRKWSWAAQAAYGVASLQTSFLSKAFSTPLSYSDPLLNSGFPPTPPATIGYASSMENGPAFNVSAIVKRNLNKRFALTAALQYSYLSLKNSVGQTVDRDTIVYRASVDRVLNQFYRSTQSSNQLQEYVNKYHFLELPIGIEWKVTRRLPLHIQTGLSLSYLFKTNALVYDPNARIYYQNNDLFSKVQVQFFSGVTYQIWQHKNLGMHVGPYFQFGLTNLEKENKDHHLLSAGAKAAISF